MKSGLNLLLIVIFLVLNLVLVVIFLAETGCSDKKQDFSPNTEPPTWWQFNSDGLRYETPPPEGEEGIPEPVIQTPRRLVENKQAALVNFPLPHDNIDFFKSHDEKHSLFFASARTIRFGVDLQEAFNFSFFTFRP